MYCNTVRLEATIWILVLCARWAKTVSGATRMRQNTFEKPKLESLSPAGVAGNARLAYEETRCTVPLWLPCSPSQLPSRSGMSCWFHVDPSMRRGHEGSPCMGYDVPVGGLGQSDTRSRLSAGKKQCNASHAKVGGPCTKVSSRALRGFRTNSGRYAAPSVRRRSSSTQQISLPMTDHDTVIAASQPLQMTTHDLLGFRPECEPARDDGARVRAQADHAENRGYKQVGKLTRHDGIPAPSQDLPSPILPGPRPSCNVIAEEGAVGLWAGNQREKEGMTGASAVAPSLQSTDVANICERHLPEGISIAPDPRDLGNPNGRRDRGGSRRLHERDNGTSRNSDARHSPPLGHFPSLRFDSPFPFPAAVSRRFATTPRIADAFLSSQLDNRQPVLVPPARGGWLPMPPSHYESVARDTCQNRCRWRMSRRKGSGHERFPCG